MEFLVLAQIIFYLTVSVAIIVLGVLCAIAAYHLIRTMKHLSNISDTLEGTAKDLKHTIREIIEKLASLPILSYLLKDSKMHPPESSRKKRS